MRNHLKIIAYAALIVAVGAVMTVTSVESALSADRAADAIEPCSNPIIEKTPLTSEIPPCNGLSGTSVAEVSEPTARYSLTIEERTAIERIVASEGLWCGYEFQALVAECVLNGCEAENMRPLDLFARGDFWITHDLEPSEETRRAVSDVFDKGIFPTAEKVRYYYNPNYCVSAVHESKTYVLTCCDCRFFKD